MEKSWLIVEMWKLRKIKEKQIEKIHSHILPTTKHWHNNPKYGMMHKVRFLYNIQML
jgi:hypothetical protein